MSLIFLAIPVCGLYIYPRVKYIIIIQSGKNKMLKISFEGALLWTSLILNTLLVFSFIIAVYHFLQYGNEIFHYEDMCMIGGNPLYFPAVLYLLFLIIIGSLLLIQLLCVFDRSTSAPLSIVINIIYIGCYYTPYVLVALIHDPLKSVFNILKLSVAVVCMYMAVWVIFIIVLAFYSHNHRVLFLSKFNAHLPMKIFISWTWVVSLAYFVLVMTNIFSFGNFTGFLVFPNHQISFGVTMVVFSLLVIFVYKHATESWKDSNKVNDDRGDDDFGADHVDFKVNDCKGIVSNGNSIGNSSNNHDNEEDAPLKKYLFPMENKSGSDERTQSQIKDDKQAESN